jgi:Tol biopolymer transport system component
MLGTLGPVDENGLRSPELSPDGRRVAVHRSVQNNDDIWIFDALRATRFTFDTTFDRYPTWSPDGNRIVFYGNRKGPADLYQKSSSGAGTEELLLESPLVKIPTDWSRDGRFLLYYISNDPKTGYDIWVLPMSGANASPIGRSQEENERSECKPGRAQPVSD